MLPNGVLFHHKNYFIHSLVCTVGLDILAYV